MFFDQITLFFVVEYNPWHKTGRDLFTQKRTLKKFTLPGRKYTTSAHLS